MDGFFSPPSVITGLLGEQEAERLRKQSIGTGLVGALIGGLSAAPNYRYGGIAPILGQALKSGFEGMQGTYTSALENYQTQQRLAEAQRQKEQQRLRDEAIAGLSAEDQAIARIDPNSLGQLLAARAKPVRFARQLSTAEAEAAGYPVDKGQMYQLTADGEVKLIPGTEPTKTEPQKFTGAYGNLANALYGTANVGDLSLEQRTALDVEARRRGLEKPPSSVFNIGIKTGGKLGESIAAKEGEKISALYETAQNVPNVLQTIQDTRNILNSGNVITGIGAEAKLDLARLGQLFGVGGKDNAETVKNTQLLFANRAQATLDAVRTSGLGAGQGFSNADREFLNKAKLGGIQFSPAALNRQLDIEERVARATANSWNTRLGKLDPEIVNTVGYMPVQLPPPQVPAGTAPKGVDQKVWNVMTPEERRLWQTR
jgi:hypothetical protein